MFRCAVELVEEPDVRRAFVRLATRGSDGLDRAAQLDLLG